METLTDAWDLMKREILAQRKDGSWLILLRHYFRGTQTVTKGCNTPDIQKS